MEGIGIVIHTRMHRHIIPSGHRHYHVIHDQRGKVPMMYSAAQQVYWLHRGITSRCLLGYGI